ncbi:MAG TPA: hypothetical protein VHL80_11175 [Polyangia bacterium]|nr:hypothetical protein [Polyangia bacterium]
MKNAMIAVALTAGAALSCGGGGSDALTCAWLAGDNCWKMTVDDAVDCLPPGSDMGTLSADDKTCTYASGVTVTFASPLVLPPPTGQNQSAKFNFTVKNGGADCLHYEDTANGFKLVVKGKTVQESVAGFGLTISCPDGTSASTGNAFGVLGCDADGGAIFGGLPGNTWSSGGTNLSFGLIGTTGSSQPVFNCAQP